MKKVFLAFIASMAFLYAVPNEITPVIGGVHPFASDKFDNHQTYGLRLGLGINKTFIDQIELGYDYSNGVKYYNSNEKSDFHRVYFNAIKEFNMSNKTKIYGIVGLGHEDISGESYSDKAGTFGQYGVGIKYYFDNYFSVRSEIRHAVKFNSGNSDLFYTIGFSIPVGNIEKAPVAEPIVQVVEEEDIEEDIIIIDEYETIEIEDEPEIAEESEILKDITKVMSLSIESFDGETAKRKRHFNFDFDKTEVLKSDEEVAERIAKELDEFQNIRVRSEGHTDSIGSGLYNLKLSQKRSEAVKNKLIEYGVAENQIETKSFGESKPIRENNTPEGRAENRRVDIVFVAPVYYFELNSAELTQEGEETLKAIAEKLEQYHKTIIIRVEGHTDSTGNKLYNLKLSQKRADKIKDRLVEYGLDQNNIETKGFGSAYPIKTNNTKEGRAANRRVDILFINRED
jgi:OOP family OmpA-OmpF porin